MTAGHFKADSVHKLTANNVAPSPFTLVIVAVDDAVSIAIAITIDIDIDIAGTAAIIDIVTIIAVDDEEAFKGAARSMTECAVNAASTVTVKLALHFVLGQRANIAFPGTVESAGNAITRRMNEDAAH